MVTTDDIIRIMKEAGIARGKCDSLAADRSLDEQGLDSYDRMSLLFEIEQNFEIDIPNDVAKDLKTLNDIVDHLNKTN